MGVPGRIGKDAREVLEQLLALLVEADDRSPWIRRLGVEIEIRDSEKPALVGEVLYLVF